MRVGVIGIFAALLIMGLAGLMQANAGVSPQYNISATIKASVSQGPAPLTVSFQAIISGSGAHDTYTYSWNFGDGTTSTASNPQHVYTNPKTYTVSLTVTDVTAKQNVVAKSLNIIATGGVSVVQSSITATNEGSGTYQFTATASGGTAPYTYFWSFGDGKNGQSTTQTIDHTYTAAQTYTVTVYVTDSNGLTSNSVTYQVAVSMSSSTQNSNSNNPSANYVWVIVVVLVIAVAILGVLIWRKYFHRKPPTTESQQPGYDSTGYAPYQYAPADAGAVAPPPADQTPAYSDAGQPPSPPATESTPSETPAEVPVDTSGAAVASAAASSGGDEGSKTCFVCGGPLSENNFCDKCQMDWGQPAASPSPNTNPA